MNRNFRKIAVSISITSVVLILGGVFMLWFALEKSFWLTTRNICVELSDQEQLVMISIDEQATYPNSMELKMTGTINGHGLLKFGWSDTSFYRSDTLRDDFNIHYERLDWYSDTCYFKYVPLTATKGDLNIDCKIFSSRK